MQTITGLLHREIDNVIRYGRIYKMKKLLGIVVLGLLFCNVSSAKWDPSYEKPIGPNGGHVKKWGNPSITKIMPIANYQCQTFNPGSRAINLKQVHKGGLWSNPEASYWHYDCEGGTQSSSGSSSSSSTDDKITQAKQICKDLGFKTNTEKFADCSLQMLSMQFEVKNRESYSSGGSQQKIVVRQGYDLGDAMIALSGIISDANNTRSSYSGGRCRIFQRDYHADLVCD